MEFNRISLEEVYELIQAEKFTEAIEKHLNKDLEASLV